MACGHKSSAPDSEAQATCRGIRCTPRFKNHDRAPAPPEVAQQTAQGSLHIVGAVRRPRTTRIGSRSFLRGASGAAPGAAVPANRTPTTPSLRLELFPPEIGPGRRTVHRRRSRSCDPASINFRGAPDWPRVSVTGASASAHPQMAVNPIGSWHWCQRVLRHSRRWEAKPSGQMPFPTAFSGLQPKSGEGRGSTAAARPADSSVRGERRLAGHRRARPVANARGGSAGAGYQQPPAWTRARYQRSPPPSLRSPARP